MRLLHAVKQNTDVYIRIIYNARHMTLLYNSSNQNAIRYNRTSELTLHVYTAAQRNDVFNIYVIKTNTTAKKITNYYSACSYYRALQSVKLF